MALGTEESVRGFLSDLSKKIIGENPSKDDVKVMSQMVGLDLEEYGVVKPSRKEPSELGSRLETRKKILDKLDPKGDYYSKAVNDSFEKSMKSSEYTPEVYKQLTDLSDNINYYVKEGKSQVASIEKGEPLQNIVIIGEDQKGDDDLQKHYAQLKDSLEKTGEPYKIIGDGTKEVTPEMIKSELKDSPIRDDVQVIIDSHGNNSRKAKGQYGKYSQQDNIDTLGEIVKDNAVKTPDAKSKPLMAVMGCYAGTSKSPDRDYIEGFDSKRTFDFASCGNRRDTTYLDMNLVKSKHLVENSDKPNFEKISDIVKADAGTMNVNGCKITGPKKHGDKGYELDDVSIHKHIKGNLSKVADALNLDDKEMLNKRSSSISEREIETYQSSFLTNAINREDANKIEAAMNQQISFQKPMIEIGKNSVQATAYDAYQSSAASGVVKQSVKDGFVEIHSKGVDYSNKPKAEYKTNPAKFIEALNSAPELVQQFISNETDLAVAIIKDSGLNTEDVFKQANIDENVQKQITEKIGKENNKEQVQDKENKPKTENEQDKENKRERSPSPSRETSNKKSKAEKDMEATKGKENNKEQVQEAQKQTDGNTLSEIPKMKITQADKGEFTANLQKAKANLKQTVPGGGLSAKDNKALSDISDSLKSGGVKSSSSFQGPTHNVASKENGHAIG